MAAEFHAFVNTAVQKALPVNWKQIPADKLLGKPPFQISHAFNTAPVDGRSVLVNILVLTEDSRIDDRAEDQLTRLRDYILSRNCLFVVISENENAGLLSDTGIFIEECLYRQSPHFLWLQCAKDQQHQTRISYDRNEELHVVLRDLWKNNIRYSGPELGIQHVNLELMADQCWKCHAEMKTVTGIVFPDKQLKSWDNSNWKYYNQLIPLAEIEGENAAVIKDYTEKLMRGDYSVTPVGVKYSQTVKASYLAASCPYCGALRGNHYVSETRTDYLHTLESRFDGSLEYHSINLHVDEELLECMRSGYEGCDHTCIAGWERS